MAIGNMNKYVDSRKVFLLGDNRESEKEEKSETEQLQNVFCHIEDLEEVTGRVKKSEIAALYLDPLASPASEIRIDY